MSVKVLLPEEAEPTWDIAQLFPAQGTWDEEEYLALDTNQLVEFSHGRLEVLPMPTWSHQRLLVKLLQLLSQWVTTHGLGEVLPAPLRVQLWPGKYREPDIVFMSEDHASRKSERYWYGADLVVEIVSPDDRRRDYEIKRREYAQAGISEYWIVDPEARRIIVLTLEGDRYRVHGEFGPGDHADSVLLKGFSVDVQDIFKVIES
ncbi:MAG: Uma2 family endonuclease [Chloroflexi bacterium]|nr:Uma2 family endonuclease [Chloroflexota bacterium]